jgi:hypothetical protein
MIFFVYLKNEQSFERMDKLSTKQKIFDACIQSQQETLDAIRQAMEEAQNAAIEEVNTLDVYESHRTQYLQKTEMFGRQYAKSLEVMEVLNKVLPLRAFDTIQFGAAVITDSQHIYISAGIGKVTVEGQEWFAISTQVPIFEAMRNKKAGDTIIFNNKKIKILEVL